MRGVVEAVLFGGSAVDVEPRLATSDSMDGDGESDDMATRGEMVRRWSVGVWWVGEVCSLFTPREDWVLRGWQEECMVLFEVRTAASSRSSVSHHWPRDDSHWR